MAEGGGEEKVSGSTPRVFISYASQDATVAEKVCVALEAAGISCWIAPRDVHAGQSYAAAIVEAINSCRTTPLLLSQGAVASPHVLREVERASSKRRPVLSVRMDATSRLPPDLEYFLSANQWLDASGKPIELILPTLVESVRNHEDRISSQALIAGGLGTRSASGSVLSPAPSKPSFRWRTLAIATALAVVAVGVAYLLTNKLWLSKHVASDLAKTAAATGVSDKSIAVLPFVDMSEKHDQEYFADGMAEEILDIVAKIPRLTVIGRTSSFQFKGRIEDLRTIGEKLGAAYVVEGSVRKAGARIRVTAQLIDTRSGTHLWSESYYKAYGDVLMLQDEIATAIARALQLTVVARGDARPLRDEHATEAYTIYLRGRLASDKFGAGFFAGSAECIRSGTTT